MEFDNLKGTLSENIINKIKIMSIPLQILMIS